MTYIELHCHSAYSFLDRASLPEELAVRDPNAAARLARAFGPDRFFVELQRPYERGDVRRNAALRDLADALRVQTVVTGDSHAHAHSRVGLQDALVAIKNRTSLDG